MIATQTSQTGQPTRPTRWVRTPLGAAIIASVIASTLLVLSIVDFATSTGSSYCEQGPDGGSCGTYSRWTRWDAIAGIGVLALVTAAVIMVTVGMLKKARTHR